MAGRITAESLERIKEATDIHDVISGYVNLKKAGRSYKGLCPFHDEKTPSFSVNPDWKRYKCFGCGENGSAFDFLMRLEGLNFREAVELLADRAGIALDREEGA